MFDDSILSCIIVGWVRFQKSWLSANIFNRLKLHTLVLEGIYFHFLPRGKNFDPLEMPKWAKMGQKQEITIFCEPLVIWSRLGAHFDQKGQVYGSVLCNFSQFEQQKSLKLHFWAKKGQKPDISIHPKPLVVWSWLNAHFDQRGQVYGSVLYNLYGFEQQKSVI